MVSITSINRLSTLSPLKKTVFLFCFLLILVIINFIFNLNPKEITSITIALLNNSYFEAFPSTSLNIEKEYRKRFNLVDGYSETVNNCTLGYINTFKLAQDHPCVLDLIRSKFMNAPVSADIPYQLDKNTTWLGETDLSDFEQVKLFKNKTSGFFVECGAYDGQQLSNTLKMEMNLNWTGLLIEANPSNYKKLLSRKRKAWTFPICLSLYPYPTKVLFVDSNSTERVATSLHIVETDEEGNKKYDGTWDKVEGQVNKPTIEIQCFPLYSVLLASNHTTIDYLSLDVEGSEMKILKTIPWDKVDIKIMRIEWLKNQPTGKLTGEQVLTQFMEGEPDYIKFAISGWDTIYFSRKFWFSDYYAPVAAVLATSS